MSVERAYTCVLVISSMIRRDRERKRRRKKQKSFCWIFLEDFFRSSNWVRKPGGPPPGKGGSARIEARPVFNMGPESEIGVRLSPAIAILCLFSRPSLCAPPPRDEQWTHPALSWEGQVHAFASLSTRARAVGEPSGVATAGACRSWRKAVHWFSYRC